jgi:hypothetical protein
MKQVEAQARAEEISPFRRGSVLASAFLRAR